MLIHNAVLTGSFSYAGADLSNISASADYSASLSTRTTNLETASGSFSTRLTAVSSSQQQISSSLLQVSASYIALSGSYNIFSGSASTRITTVSSSQQDISSSQQQISASLLNVIAIGATTGSNSFRADQSITGSLVVSSTITAQTLVVQTVTSSIVYSSGSNNFGNQLANTQTFTGSVNITGSLTVNTTGTEFQVTNNGVVMGNLSTDNHNITGSLRITGNVISNGYMQVTNSSNPSLYINNNVVQWQTYIKSNNNIAISDAVTDVLTLGYNGSPSFFQGSNVGIGTTTPVTALEVLPSITNSSIKTGGIEIQSYAVNNGWIADNMYYSGSWKARATGHSTQIYFGNGTISFTRAASTGSGATISPVTSMIIDTAGNVQIGNDSNPYLEIANGGSTDVTSGIKWMVGSGRTYYGAIDLATPSASNSYLLFSTMNSGTVAERLRITNAGIVQLGNTSYSPRLQFKTGGSTAYFATINMDSKNDYISINGGDSTGYASGADIGLVGANRYGTATAGQLELGAGSAANNTSYGYIAFYTANTLRMQISFNGAIGTTAGGTNIYNPSDIRLKKNITPISYGLDTVMALKPSKFNWKEKFAPSEENKNLLGFIAQEVQTVIPEAVESFGQDVYVNTEGIQYTVENPLRVNEKFIIPVLVKAIQELKAELDTAKAQITELKNK